LLARIDYNTLARLPELRSPILIIHSPNDDVIPYAHGQRLFAAAQEPKEFLSIQGGHNDGYIRSAALYEARLGAFLQRHLVEK
jgi:hypothetical protein